MTVRQLLLNDKFTLVNEGDLDREISGIYCCDLLSIVMGRAPADCVWITVMGNINGVAVAVLADMACIIIAEGIEADRITIEKAASQGVNIIKTELPIFTAAMLVNGGLNV